MKKSALITLLTVASFLIVNNGLVVTTLAGEAWWATALFRPIMVSRLPPELIVPAALPSSIQDLILMEAWVRLYNHQEPIPLWYGGTLTGRDLAQFVLDHGIPVVWDAGRVCAGGNCSVRYCDGAACSFDDRLHPGIKPIYLAPIAEPHGTNMQFLVGTLAHEIFHRTEPFGAVKDTKFEEYWAFWIGAKIGKNGAPKFGGIDPLSSGELYVWLLKNRMDFYYALPEYPLRVIPLVQSHS